MINCTQPWFEMQIEYNERVGCCCYYKHERDHLELPVSVEKYWNSEILQDIRTIIASNNTKDTGCEGCQLLKHTPLTDFTKVPDCLNQAQKTNWERALYNYDRRVTVVDSYPVKYYLNFGLLCNLRCIMCSQENSRKDDCRLLPVEPLLALKRYFTVADEIMVIGGEPFVLPNARRFIDAIISDPDYADIKLSIVTNGTLLHNYLDQLKSIRRVNIWVSLDSIDSAYEHIRQGARWGDTERNILAFREIGAKHNLDWTINIGSVVMKSSIAKLDEFVDWCIDNDLPVHFVPIQPYEGVTSQEDIFCDPGLLNDLPAWEDIFDCAIERLTQKNWIAAAARPLSLMKNEIKSRSLIIQGEDIFNRGNIRDALALFLEAAEKDPSSAPAFNNTGVAYYKMGEFTKALRYFARALRIDMNNRETVINCIKLLTVLGKSEDATNLYVSYLKNNPADEAILNAFA